MELKQCIECGEVKEINLFSFRDKSKNILHRKCKVCHSTYRNNHYQDNKQKYIDKAKKYMYDVRDWYKEYKKSLTCKNCGDSRWWVLGFHHRDSEQKDYTISLMSKKGSKRKMLEEMSKCDVLCANCHRDVHYQIVHRSKG